MKRVLGAIMFSLALLVWGVGCSNRIEVYQYKYDSKFDEVFIKQGVDFRKYQSVMIESVSVWYPAEHAPSPENVELARANLAQAQELFLETLNRALSDRYRITDRKGKNVLRVRVEFIDLRAVPIDGPVPRELDRFSFKTRPGHITMIARLLDSQSGEQLARAADLGKRASAGGEAEVDWEAIASDFDYWATVFRGWLDQVNNGG